MEVKKMLQSKEVQYFDCDAQKSQKKNCFESKYFVEYRGKIPELSQQKIAALKLKLRVQNFRYNLQNSFSFKKTITKIKQDCLNFYIEYGSLSTQLCIYCANIDPEIFYGAQINAGRFGKVFLFSYKQKNYACKQLHQKVDFDNQNGDRFLKEIFMSKFASAIGVGPKFICIFGFDAMVINKKGQFVMEYCPDYLSQVEKINKQESQNLKNIPLNLIENISLLHSLNFIHFDIKPQNVSWSSQRKKFILLDYGLSEFIQGRVGSLSLSSYKGSYRYTSKQMKNAYRLGNCLFMDLYYNDYYGLQKSWKQIMKNQNQISQNQTFENEPITHQIGQISIFYRLRYEIFKENLEQIVKIIGQNNNLKHTFRLILYEEWQQSIHHKKSVQWHSIYTKYNDSCKLQSFDKNFDGLDKILYSNTSRTYAQGIDFVLEYFMNKNIKNFQLKIWKKPKLVAGLFDYLYFSSKFTVEKKKIITSIYQKLQNKVQNCNYIQQYMQVLRRFSLHFFQENNFYCLYQTFLIFRFLKIPKYIEISKGLIISLARSKEQQYLLEGIRTFYIEIKIRLQVSQTWQYSLANQLLKTQCSFFAKEWANLISQAFHITDILPTPQSILNKNELCLNRFIQKFGYEHAQVCSTNKFAWNQLKVVLKQWVYKQICQNYPQQNLILKAQDQEWLYCNLNCQLQIIYLQPQSLSTRARLIEIVENNPISNQILTIWHLRNCTNCQKQDDIDTIFREYIHPIFVASFFDALALFFIFYSQIITAINLSGFVHKKFAENFVKLDSQNLIAKTQNRFHMVKYLLRALNVVVQILVQIQHQNYSQSFIDKIQKVVRFYILHQIETSEVNLIQIRQLCQCILLKCNYVKNKNYISLQQLIQICQSFHSLNFIKNMVTFINNICIDHPESMAKLNFDKFFVIINQNECGRQVFYFILSQNMYFMRRFMQSFINQKNYLGGYKFLGSYGQYITQNPTILQKSNITMPVRIFINSVGLNFLFLTIVKKLEFYQLSLLFISNNNLLTYALVYCFQRLQMMLNQTQKQRLTRAISFGVSKLKFKDKQLKSIMKLVLKYSKKYMKFGVRRIKIRYYRLLGRSVSTWDNYIGYTQKFITRAQQKNEKKRHNFWKIHSKISKIKQNTQSDHIYN